jgi:hypothetical protein
MTCEAHSPMVEAWLVFIAPQPKKTDLNKACLFSRNKKGDDQAIISSHT